MRKMNFSSFFGIFIQLLIFASGARAGMPPDSTQPLSGKTAPMPGSVAPGKPRLAFLELSAGPEVTREVAQAAGEMLVVALSDTGKFDVITKADVKALLGYEAQAQLMGCGEASCMVDLGGALGAAYLVNGSLGRLGGQLQLTLALIDVNAATVGKRVSLGLNDSALQAGMRDAIQRLTGEVAPDAGAADACGSPPCARVAGGSPASPTSRAPSRCGCCRRRAWRTRSSTSSAATRSSATSPIRCPC